MSPSRCTSTEYDDTRLLWSGDGVNSMSIGTFGTGGMDSKPGPKLGRDNGVSETVAVSAADTNWAPRSSKATAVST